MIEAGLKKPFPDDAIHWRIGSRSGDKKKGMPLAYIDARDVMDRLDEVVGGGHWEDSYTETSSGRVICSLTIDYPGIGPVTKTDGAGNTGTEGEKGAISDAFKRAAVKHGIGRYLYSMPNQWVEFKKERSPGSIWTKDGFFTPPNIPQELTEKAYKHKLSHQIDKEVMQKVLFSLLEALRAEDGLQARETLDELSSVEQSYVWAFTSTKQKEAIRSLLHALTEESA